VAGGRLHDRGRIGSRRLFGPAAPITRSSLDRIAESGFAEYHDPLTGAPLGGGRFAWMAAMAVEFQRVA
jgi:hypothetical protein